MQTNRRNALRLIGGGAIAAATVAMTVTGCSSELPAEAVAPWQGPGAETDHGYLETAGSERSGW